MGTDDKPAAAQNAADTDGIIDRLYEVAVDPSRYEALLDHWEAMIGPERLAAHQSKPSVIGLDHLAGHIERADQVLDCVLRDEVSNGPQSLIDQIDHSVVSLCPIIWTDETKCCRQARNVMTVVVTFARLVKMSPKNWNTFRPAFSCAELSARV